MEVVSTNSLLISNDVSDTPHQRFHIQVLSDIDFAGVEDRIGFLTASCLMDEFSRNIGKKMKLFVRRESEVVWPVIIPGHVAQERRS